MPPVPHIDRAPAPTRLGAGPPYVFPGEQMAFVLTWFDLPIAKLRIGVGQPGDLRGRRSIVLRADVQSDGIAAVVKQIRDVMTTAVDLETGVPIANSGTFEALYMGETANRDLDGAPDLEPWTHHESDGEIVLDSLAAAGTVRAWSAVAKPGEHASFHGMIGSGSHLVELVMGDREEIVTRMGHWPVRRLEGVITSWRRYRFTLWFSDDNDRLPVKMVTDTDYGAAVTMELTGYERP